MFHDDPLGPPLASPVLASSPVEAARSWRLLDVIAGSGLAILAFVATLGASAAIIIQADYARNDPRVALLLTLATLGMEAALGVIVLGLARLRGVSAATLGLRRSPQGWYIAAALFGAYACVLAYAAAAALIERATGADLSWIPEGNQIPDDLPRTVAIWTTLGLAVAVVAPLAEELFFRGLVYRGIEGRFGPVAGMLVSGVAFSLVHFNLSVVVPFTLIGIIFAGVYRASGSLWTTIAAHAIFNGVSFAAAVYGVGQ
jgi:membrane protease YdiL (CAAX protease family)